MQSKEKEFCKYPWRSPPICCQIDEPTQSGYLLKQYNTKIYSLSNLKREYFWKILHKINTARPLLRYDNKYDNL